MISIIIPNYNGEELLARNLPKVVDAVKRYAIKMHTQAEIIIVDDASADNSVSELTKYIAQAEHTHIRFQLFENKKNLGFSSTVNKGVKNSRGDIVILLNTDVVPEIDFLHPLLGHFSDNSVFAVGCIEKSIEDGKTVLRGRGVGKWQRGFLIHKKGDIEKKDTLWVSGGSGAFRKAFWHRLGGLNELYNPFYWEDIDLSYRALKSGYKVLFDSRSVVTHEHEKGAIKRTRSQSEVKRISYRNQFIFTWVNMTDKEVIAQHILWLPYHKVKALLRGDTAFFLGLIDALRRLPEILRYRKMATKYFVKGDQVVTAAFREG